MGVIYYGTRTFSKFMGYFGPRQECENCHKTYKKSFVRFRSWAHIDYIPLFPTKTVYYKACPICGQGFEVHKKDAKVEMQNPGDAGAQELEPYAKHILANKPKGILKTDSSYEFWIRDKMTGEEICIDREITKDDVKNIKKARGYKKVPVEEVK